MTGFRSAVTRRQAIELIAMTAAAALPSVTAAQQRGPEFPKGAVIRALLKDYAPEDLAGGATLFHEHMTPRKNGPPASTVARRSGVRVRMPAAISPKPARRSGMSASREVGMKTTWGMGPAVE